MFNTRFIVGQSRLFSSLSRRRLACSLASFLPRPTLLTRQFSSVFPTQKNSTHETPATPGGADVGPSAPSLNELLRSVQSKLPSAQSETLSEPRKEDVAKEVQTDKVAQPQEDDDTPGADDFLTTIFEDSEPFIDTYEVYKQLLSAGFTPSQSDEIINLLVVQLNTKLTKLLTKYSQLYELENERYLFESAQQELRVDVTRNREQHINEAINQINVLERDYGIISDELNNAFLQMKNDVQVAINDQKSENTLLSKKIQLRIQETNHKISTELNMAMRSEIESLRWHLSRWGLIAILVSVFSACTAFYVYKIRHQRQMSERSEFVPLVIYEPSELDEDDYHADLDPNVI